jgi:hypothetical protein
MHIGFLSRVGAALGGASRTLSVQAFPESIDRYINFFRSLENEF